MKVFEENIFNPCCRSCDNKEKKDQGVFSLPVFITCKKCGNKRCPKATNHNNDCTNSNKPNQKGSIF